MQPSVNLGSSKESEVIEMRKVAVLASPFFAAAVGAAVLLLGLSGADSGATESADGSDSKSGGLQSEVLCLLRPWEKSLRPWLFNLRRRRHRGEWSADTRNTWTDNDGQPRVQFNLRTSAGDSRWGFGVRLRELAGLPASAVSNMASDVQFSWTREAGTFRFTGTFDQGRGNGTYTFTRTRLSSTTWPLPATEPLHRRHRPARDRRRHRGPRPRPGAGRLRQPVARRLVRSRIHGSRPSSSATRRRRLQEHRRRRLVRMGIHGATPANIKALQDAGIRGQSVEDLIRFRIHKVTPEFIRAMEARGYRTSPPKTS